MKHNYFSIFSALTPNILHERWLINIETFFQVCGCYFAQTLLFAIFFHALRTKRSGFKPHGSHIIGSWIPWILRIALGFSSTWWLLLEKDHLVTFKFYIFDKICGLHRLRKIAKIQLSSLIVLILFRMNSLIALSTDRNEVSNNIFFLYWMLCWCLVITNTSL